MAAWDRGQLQGRRLGAFQDSTDLKGRQEGEMVYKVVRQRAEASQVQGSLTEEKTVFFLSHLDFSFIACNQGHIS